MKKVLTIVFALFTAATASAQSSPVSATSNTATAALTLSSTVAITANINTALALDIQQSGSGCVPTVSGSSPSKTYTFAFGNVDGLGLSTPAACVTKTAATSGTGFLFTTPYKYVARFSGFTPSSSGAPKLTAYYSQGGVSTSAVQVIEGSTAATATALSQNSATPTNIGTSLTSDSSNTGVARVIGLQVFEYNGAGATPNSATASSYTATVTYVLAPQ